MLTPGADGDVAEGAVGILGVPGMLGGPRTALGVDYPCLPHVDFGIGTAGSTAVLALPVAEATPAMSLLGFGDAAPSVQRHPDPPSVSAWNPVPLWCHILVSPTAATLNPRC